MPIASPAQVHFEIDGAVAILTLDHPPLNTVTQDTIAALDAHFERIARDATIRAVVVAAAGERAFCVGSDIRAFEELSRAGQMVSGKLRHENEVFSRLARLPRPTVAAIEGYALGGGLEIAACCDFIVCGESAKLGLPEIRLAALPAIGGTFRVTHRIGVSRAKELLLLGEPVDAATALAWGLVNRVVATGQARRTALEVAHKLARNPLECHVLCREAIDSGSGLPEQQAIEQSLSFSGQLEAGRDFREGARAFLAKEQPVFVDVPAARAA